jgi:hypothetical protein
VTSSAEAAKASAVSTGGLWSARRRSAWESSWPLALYAAISFLLFGLPILDDPTGNIIAADEIDSSVFMWFYGWWPHALLNGLNPFVTGHQFVPEGFNLQWSTSMPLPSLLLSPVTLTLGPSATWNLIQLASPALSAWTAFLLCRHITGRVWPSVAAGYVFGFSPYMLVHLTGGPYLALVPLVPLFVLLVLRRIQDDISPRRFTVAMTVALTAQYLISIEVLATATVFGAVALVAAFVLYPEHRGALVAMGKKLIVAYAATAVLVGPFLYYFFFGDRYPPGATYFRADLASFVLPPNALAITKSHSPDDVFRGAVFEAYLGLPLIALLAAFAWQYRRRRSTWLLLLCLVVPAITMLGEKLIVRGRLTDIPLPWAILGDLPVLEHAIPVRFALFVALAAAVIVALWLTAGGLARWALTVLVIASFLPNAGAASWETNINDPAFFETGQYRDHLEPEDHVLTLPVWGPNERWQADTEFAFKLAAGYLGNPFPPSYSRYPIWDAFLTAELPRDYAGQLRRFVRDKGVTAIVVDKRHPGPWRKLFGTLGERPLDIGGVLFYRLGRVSGRSLSATLDWQP